MQTIKIPIQNQLNITQYQKIYSSCFRYSYNRFKDGLNEKDIRLLTKAKFKLNSWLIQSAITEAKTFQKIFKDKKVIFGSKLNWNNYINKEITKDEFKNKRLMSICSFGEKNYKGNRFFTLNIINDNAIIFKPNKNTKYTLQLPKLRNNIKSTLYKLEELSKSNKIPLTIHLTSKNISISFDETLINSTIYKGMDNRILGIDMNPNYIGYSILEFNKENEFEVIYKEVINLSNLNIKSNKNVEDKESKYLVNKREFEIYQIVKYILNKAKQYKVSKIVIEELSNFGKTKSKEVNRLVKGCWNRNKFVSNLKKHCNIYGIELIEVNTAYSSFIGNIQYGNEVDCPDMVASSIEIGRRGYRKFVKEWFYPKLKNKDNLMKLWKQDLDWSSLTWKKLFEEVKESKLKYRFPLNKNLKFFRLKSYKSNINLYQFI